MPNRIIRESATTSPTLNQLSDFAERLFWRLTVVADDFGRFEAHPSILLAKTFPLKVKTMKTSKISLALSEFVNCGLVTTYDINMKSYGFFNTWEKHQRKRASQSKYPSPSSADIGGHPPRDASESSIREARHETRDTRHGELGERFESFWKSYPKRKSKGSAERAWAKINPNVQHQAAIMDGLERAKTSEEWQKDNGEFIPYPATWLNARGWEDEESASNNKMTEQEIEEMVRETRL